MMRHVANDDEPQRQSGDRRIARDAPAQPGSVVERADQGNSGAANGNELCNQAGQLLAGTVRYLHVVVLLETWKRCLVPASDPEKAVREDAFGIVDMAEKFLDG